MSKDKYTSQTVPAEEVMQDDRLRLGGNMYKVWRVSTDKDRAMTQIVCYPINEVDDRQQVFHVSAETGIKIYNQIPDRRK